MLQKLEECVLFIMMMHVPRWNLMVLYGCENRFSQFPSKLKASPYSNGVNKRRF